MIYLPNNYSNYKYLVESHDNYIILSKDSYISGSSGDPDYIDVVYQYFTPSIYTIESSYSSEHSISFTNISDSLSDSIFDRADFPLIFICNFIILLIFCFIINQLSKLVYKGGLFGSN